MIPTTETDLHTKVTSARETLDAWTRQMVEWHFSPETGCPFWLDYTGKLGWDPRREIRSYDDLGRLGPFQDEWLRGGPVSRWVPRGLAGKPIYVFETGGSTGVPKGVMLTHANVLANVNNFNYFMRHGEGGVYLHAAPLFHIADFPAIFATPIFGGCQLTLPRFSILACLCVKTQETRRGGIEVANVHDWIETAAVESRLVDTGQRTDVGR